MLRLIPSRFDVADLTHDAATARRLRTLSGIVAVATARDPALRAAALGAPAAAAPYSRIAARLSVASGTL